MRLHGKLNGQVAGALAAAFGFIGLLGAATPVTHPSPSPLLPAIASTQSFAASVKVQLPQRPSGGRPGGFGHNGGPPTAGPGATPNSQPGGAPQGQGQGGNFPHDQSGTLTLKRTASNSVQVTTGGDLDALDSAFTINANGAIDPGDTPNQFIIAFDNAAALLAQAPAQPQVGDTWPATIQVLTMGNSLPTQTVNVKVLGINGTEVTLLATGSGTITISTPHGDRPADVKAALDLTTTAGKIATYTQQISQTIKTPYRSFTVGATTSLTSN